MSMESHIAQLQKKHAALEAKLEEVMRHPGADDLEVATLKREKLKLKDEIERLTHKIAS